MSDYRYALRAYPVDYREEHGWRLAVLANELSPRRWSLRQSASLVAGGLRTRARISTGCSSRGVWEGAARIALLAWMAMGAAPPLLHLLGVPWAPAYRESLFVLALSVLPVVVLTISTRWWAATLITVVRGWASWDLVGEPMESLFLAGFVGSTVLTVGLAWWLALATDGRRAAGPFVSVSLTLAGLVWWSGLLTEGPFASAAVASPILVILVGLAVSRSDPRLAATTAVMSTLWFLPMIPLAAINGDTGWNYWGPIVSSVALLALPLMAARSGTRRLLNA